MTEQITTGFKGFDKDFKCRGMQYKVGETAEMSNNKPLEICANGLHFCENPIDILGYYAPVDDAGNPQKFAEVEGLGDKVTHNEDSKIAVKKLFIKAEITLHNLLSIGAKFILSKVDFKNAPATNTGDRSAATNTGDSSAATNTGDSSAATNTGYSSAATNTGDRSAATNTGDRSAATNTGYSSAAVVEGSESVAISLGIEGRAKGIVGCWLVLAEWEQVNNEWHRTNVKSFKVDGKKVKPDTFYILTGGKLVETK